MRKYKELKNKTIATDSIKTEMEKLQHKLQSQDREFFRQLCVEFVKQGLKDPEDIIELAKEIIKGNEV